ncbi:transport between ER and Golgi ATPase protein [Gonapodya sp. JEL0774]|nr:transport between ER and Golgi ATPase protein [Gonapodya sp. JEL0774]
MSLTELCCYPYLNHVKLCNSVYQKAPGLEGPNQANLSRLLFYASSRPHKLVKIGVYLDARLKKDLYAGRLGALNVLTEVTQCADGEVAMGGVGAFISLSDHLDHASITPGDIESKYFALVENYAKMCRDASGGDEGHRSRLSGLKALQSLLSSPSFPSYPSAARVVQIALPAVLGNVVIVANEDGEGTGVTEGDTKAPDPHHTIADELITGSSLSRIAEHCVTQSAMGYGASQQGAAAVVAGVVEYCDSAPLWPNPLLLRRVLTLPLNSLRPQYRPLLAASLAARLAKSPAVPQPALVAAAGVVGDAVAVAGDAAPLAAMEVMDVMVRAVGRSEGAKAGGGAAKDDGVPLPLAEVSLVAEQVVRVVAKAVAGRGAGEVAGFLSNRVRAEGGRGSATSMTSELKETRKVMLRCLAMLAKEANAAVATAGRKGVGVPLGLVQAMLELVNDLDADVRLEFAKFVGEVIIPSPGAPPQPAHPTTTLFSSDYLRRLHSQALDPRSVASDYAVVRAGLEAVAAGLEGGATEAAGAAMQIQDDSTSLLDTYPSHLRAANAVVVDFLLRLAMDRRLSRLQEHVENVKRERQAKGQWPLGVDVKAGQEAWACMTGALSSDLEATSLAELNPVDVWISRAVVVDALGPVQGLPTAPPVKECDPVSSLAAVTLSLKLGPATKKSTGSATVVGVDALRDALVEDVIPDNRSDSDSQAGMVNPHSVALSSNRTGGSSAGRSTPPVGSSGAVLGLNGGGGEHLQPGSAGSLGKKPVKQSLSAEALNILNTLVPSPGAPQLRARLGVSTVVVSGVTAATAPTSGSIMMPGLALFAKLSACQRPRQSSDYFLRLLAKVLRPLSRITETKSIIPMWGRNDGKTSSPSGASPSRSSNGYDSPPSSRYDSPPTSRSRGNPPTNSPYPPSYPGPRVFRVNKSPDERFAMTNCVAICQQDFGPNVRYILVDDQFAFSVRPSPAIPPSELGTTLFHRRFASFSLNQEVRVRPYDPFEEHPDSVLSTAQIQVDFYKKTTIMDQPFDSDELGKIFTQNFQGQVFSKGQSLLMDVKGVNLQLDIKDLSALDVNGMKKGSTEEPSKPVIMGVITPATQLSFVKAANSTIKLKGSMKSGPVNAIIAPSFKFEDLGIGGLDKEFGAIFRRAFASRIFPPALVERLGIQHVKGILLYGPPGTGKTLMARQIGKMLNAKEPLIVNGPEVLNKFVGQSEENIRKLFAPAEADYKSLGDDSPLHIIIFDELDAICKQRGSTNTGTGVGDTVVNQLLSKMDGVDQLNNILIIGMTNRKDMIDEALLRPGRLEIHLEINLPDENGRVAILTIHTAKARKNNLLAADVDLLELAALTKNFSGAEIAGLVKAATAWAFNRHVKGGTMASVAPDVDKMQLCRDDFMRALEEVKPAFGVSDEELSQCTRNGIFKYNDDVKESSHIKLRLNALEDTDIRIVFQDILANSQLFVEQVRNSPRTPLVSVLFYGPHGAGKTAIAATIAMASEFPFIKLISPESMLGFTEQSKMAHITKVFNDAYKSPYSIVVVDEIERLLDWVAIGPRFSNAVLQTLVVLLRKNPPKGRRLLILATTSQRAILDQLDMTNCFDDEVEVPPIRDLNSVQAVLAELNPFESDAETQRCLKTLRNDGMEGQFSIGVKKLIMLAEMASQDADKVGKFIQLLSSSQYFSSSHNNV